MNRKEGYYWVKHGGEWKVGLWTEHGVWRLPFPCHRFTYDPSEIDCVDEVQILPPNN